MSVTTLTSEAQATATPGPHVEAKPPAPQPAAIPQDRTGPDTTEALQADPRLTHLLRLSLDLQLDAMLFMLGAAATHQDASAASEAYDSERSSVVNLSAAEAESSTPSVPWRRWMTEDLELSRCLASTAASLGLALPPTLGRAGRHENSRLVAEDLIARYEFMANLLDDLLERAAVSTPQSLLEPVADALTRIGSRLDELRAAAAHPEPFES